MKVDATGMLATSKVLEAKFGHWWVDDEGAWNFWGIERPIDSEGRERVAQSYRRIALHRLGMVQVTRRPGRDLVEFDLHRVHDTAMDATVDFLTATPRLGPVELCFYHRAWNMENYFDGVAAARRIQEVRSFRDVVLANTVTTLRRPLSAPGMVSPRVRDALRLAEVKDAKLTLADCAELIPRLVIYRPDDRLGGGPWVSLHAGHQSSCAQVYGQDWAREAPGRPYRVDEPGRRYSFNMMKAYAGVFDTGTPRLDHIRAIMRRPGKDPLWVPYQRLLFRAAAENGEPLLCCLSDITQDIAIPFMRASA